VKAPQIAVTGGIACGKSSAAEVLEAAGFAILDTDTLAHSLMRKGEEAYREVVEYFGTAILDKHEQIDRKKLGNIVFSDDEKRQKLNQLVHPKVRQAWKTWQAEKKKSNIPSAVLIPLLFEAGLEEGWDEIICIAADPETMLERLKARGFTEKESADRIMAQMPIEEKARRATKTIYNNNTKEEFITAVRELAQQLLNKE